MLPGLRFEDFRTPRRKFTFLVHDRPLASRFPYRVQGHAMYPVRWSLKNQRTAQAVPIADILRRVGIGVCVVVAAPAEERLLLPHAEGAAPMTTLERQWLICVTMRRSRRSSFFTARCFPAACGFFRRTA